MKIYMVYDSSPNEFDIYSIKGFFLTKEEAENRIQNLKIFYPKTPFDYRDFEISEGEKQ